MRFAFAFFCGGVAFLTLPEIPSPWVWVGMASLGIVGAVLRRSAGVALCAASVGWLYAGYHAVDYLEDRWPVRSSGERVIAQVVVDSIPALREGGWSFDGVVRVEKPVGHPRPLRVRLISRDASVQPHAGERWRLLLTLRPPQGRANPGTQDFERQLFRDRVHALGTVTASSMNRRVDAGHAPLTALRERISLHIQERVVDSDAAALIAALAVGDTGNVSREQWRVFNATGTTHLVAISGLHVTLFAVVAFALARWMWRYCYRLVRMQRDSFASICAFSAAAAYATLAGLSVPTMRTLIMLGAWLLSRSIARVTRPFQPLGIALLAVLVFDPFAPLSAGFWLSFVAMAVIILVSSGRAIPRPMWREALCVQGAVTVGLVPCTLALFGSVSLIGPAVNVVAIPAMSWVLVPTVLLAVVLMPVSISASDYVLALAEWFHDAGWPWLAATGDIPWALLHAAPPWWWYGIAALALAMALMPWPLLLRLSALFCTVPLAVSAIDVLPVGAVEITVLDAAGVGVVARTARHVLVFGTGDSYGTDGRVAENVVVPYLRHIGIREVDVLVTGAATAAASTGVTALLAQMPVQQTLVGCESGSTTWSWDGVRFELSETPGHACQMDIVTPRGRASIPGRNASIAAVIEESGERGWAVSSRRRAPRAANTRAMAGATKEGVQVIATSEHGALRFLIDGDKGVSEPSAYRADKRTLWSVSP